MKQGEARPGCGAGVQPLLTTIKLDFSRVQRKKAEVRGKGSQETSSLALSLGDPQKSLLRSPLKVLGSEQKGPGHNYPVSPRKALWGEETRPSRGLSQ